MYVSTIEMCGFDRFCLQLFFYSIYIEIHEIWSIIFSPYLTMFFFIQPFFITRPCVRFVFFLYSLRQACRFLFSLKCGLSINVIDEKKSYYNNIKCWILFQHVLPKTNKTCFFVWIYNKTIFWQIIYVIKGQRWALFVL